MVAFWSRIIGLLMAVLALALLQACSAVKLAYNNAPDVVYWWLDGYADFNEAQTLKVREELARLHQWHRSTELPKIADLLQRVAPMANKDTTAEQVCTLFTEVRGRLDAVVTQVEPAAVALAMGLSPAQLMHMEQKFAKNNADWRDDWMDGSTEERRAKRLKGAVERGEQFYGTLDERQLAVLRGALARSDFDPQFSYAERLRRQRDLLQTLRQVSSGANGVDGSRIGVPQATAALRAYLDRTASSPNPAYRVWSDKAILDNCRTVALLHNGTTAEQRERAVRRLGAYERDARELAAQR